MGLKDNRVALIILLFIIFSVFGNLFVWLKITGNLAIGKASLGYIGICIDRPPTLEAISDQTAITERNFTYQLNATDSSTPIYYYNITPSNLRSFSMNHSSGLINFTPSANETGNYPIYIWATHDICGNNSNDSETFTLSVVLPQNIPYWINYTRNFSVTEDILFTVNLSTFVLEPDNETFNFTHNSTSTIFPSFGMSLTGLINFTVNDSDVGIHWMNITVRDARNAANSSIFNFSVNNVNDAPLLQPIPGMQACEDSAFTYQANASDDDLLVPAAYRAEVLHYYDNSSLFVINEDTGLISFTPTYLQAAVHNIRIYVSDEEASDFKDFPLNIIGINDAPVLQSIGPQTIYINSSFNYSAYASDEEDGDTPGTPTFNSTFLNGTKFFDINAATGNINFTANASINGTYTVRICVTDNGLSNPNANLSFCNETASAKNDCENVQFTITAVNHAPNITSYSPINLNQTINEGESITFNASATDEEGTTPSLMWYKNRVLMLTNSTYTFTTSSGDAGRYNITVVASDGDLNSSVGWNVTVTAVAAPAAAAAAGGGGGGGGACTELWLCTDWSMCQNASAMESKILLGNLYEKIMLNCSINAIPFGNCGFQTRSCYDKNKCGSTAKKPEEMKICTFTLSPNCFDGILNCHNGQCEILPDCGGTCKPCPTCSDGIQNQGEEFIDCGGPCPDCPVEYPLARCGDKKCEISELFGCRRDCGFFWSTSLLSLIIAMILIILARREILTMKAKGMEKESRKRRKHLYSLIALAQRAINEKDSTLARHYYSQTRNYYNSLPSQEKKKFYSKIIKLFSEINRLKG